MEDLVEVDFVEADFVEAQRGLEWVVQDLLEHLLEELGQDELPQDHLADRTVTLPIDPAGDTTGMGTDHGIVDGGITRGGMDDGIDRGTIPLSMSAVE